MTIKQLLIDGYVVKDTFQEGAFRLTAEGRRFIRNGGYKVKFEEEEK